MESRKHRISDSVKELLKSPHFVLWCYNPTEENETWCNNWIESHPERKSDIELARKILLSTELNTFDFKEIDSKNLLLRIEASVKTRKRRRRQRRIVYSIAAVSIICAILSGLWINTQHKNSQNNFIPNIAATSIDSIQTEIELELGAREKLLVANKATIKLDEQGTVHIDDDEIKENHLQPDTAINPTNTNMNILKVPRGRHTDILLVDGSRIWVNSGTVVQFPTQFAEDHRTIYADGEVYLEVARDESRPFFVKTSQMTVQVLGTSFNITSYVEDMEHSIVLKEGQVEVSTTGGQKQSMLPNDRLVLEGSDIKVSKVDPYYYTSWIDGVFLFKKQNMKQIAQRLSRYYRLNIVCVPEVENYKCNGKLVLFDHIDKVLHTLEEGLPVKCEYDGDTIYININSKRIMPMEK